MRESRVAERMEWEKDRRGDFDEVAGKIPNVAVSLSRMKAKTDGERKRTVCDGGIN